jgi:hypothetical protein
MTFGSEFELSIARLSEMNQQRAQDANGAGYATRAWNHLTTSVVDHQTVVDIVVNAACQACK